MVGTVPDRVQLGAATSNRKWLVDLRDPATQLFVGLFGMMEFKFKPGEATTNDDSDWEGEGWQSSTIAGLAWGGEGKVARKTKDSNPAAYDDGQEILRKAAQTMRGRVYVRVYEMEPGGPRVEAYEGWCTPTWSPDGGNTTADETVSFTLAGRGKPKAIAHPEGATAKPVIASVLPAGAAAGASVVISGDYFTGVAGATGVKFGATNATSYTVLDDDTILAVLPAGAAGSAPVVVGTSDPKAYTRA